jgi:hypothetical protein
MASFLYKNHLIVVSSQLDPATESWTAAVIIHWTDEGSRLKTLNTSAKRWKTMDESERGGLELGKQWIDERAKD